MAERDQLRRRWLSTQRKLLIMVVAAYRTVSYEALWLVSGIESLDLKVEWKLGVVEDVARGMDVGKRKEARWQELLTKWHERWWSSTKGRGVTFEYCDDVRDRVAAEWKMSH